MTIFTALKKKIILIPFCTLLFIGITIIALEQLSNSCPGAKTRKLPDCYTLINTYVSKGDVFPIWENLLPRNPIDEDLTTVINTRIFEASREDLRDVNGIACSRYGFVDRNLPKAAKLYVKTHEALHLLGVSDETETNYLAAVKYPIGMVETMLYTTYVSFKNKPLEKYPCILTKNWVIFKTYFLHFKTRE